MPSNPGELWQSNLCIAAPVLFSHVGVACLALGKTSESVRYFERSHELLRRLQGDSNPDTLGERINLGFVLAKTGGFERGIELLKSVLEADGGNAASEAVNGARYNLSAVLADRCERIGLQLSVSDELREESIRMGREAVAYASSLTSDLGAQARLLGDAVESREAWARRKLAVGLVGNKQYEEALEQFAAADAVQGSNDPSYCFVEAAALYWLGNDDQGDQCFEEAQQWLLSNDDVPIRTIQFREVADRAIRESTPAYAAYLEKDWEEAQRLFEENVERYKAMGRPAPAIVLQRLANCLVKQRKLAEAEEMYRRSLGEAREFQIFPCIHHQYKEFDERATRSAEVRRIPSKLPSKSFRSRG